MKPQVATAARTDEVLRNIGRGISVSRRARNWKQEDLAGMADIGMNTMVAIEKGAGTVQIGSYLSVLSALGLLHTLSDVANPGRDDVAVSAMMENLPARAGAGRRR